MPNVMYSAAGFKWTNEDTVSQCISFSSRGDQLKWRREKSIKDC